jgi:dTDP-4-dehydrorhamnose reductase
MMERHAVILGRNGQLAREIALTPWPSPWRLSFVGRHQLPRIDRSTVADLLSTLCPDLIINTAAYTAVDQAEDDADRSYLLNADLPGHIASYCSTHSIPLLHISTDYVFAGTGRTPLNETAAVAPLSVYGASKLDGEERIRNQLRFHLILRTSWLFGQYSSNFFTKMMELGETRRQLNVINDQWGGPTPAAALAASIPVIASELLQSPASTSGLFHFSGWPEATWFQFANTIMSVRQAVGLPWSDITPTSTAAFGARAKRPAYSYLDCRKFRDRFGVQTPNWQHGLPALIKTYNNNGMTE